MLARSTRLLILVFALTLLCACGQKGNLYLPEAKYAELDVRTASG